MLDETGHVEAWSSLIAVYDLVAGPVAAEDHRPPFLADADSLQGPQIVVVERGAALTVTLVQPAGTADSGRSPTPVR